MWDTVFDFQIRDMEVVVRCPRKRITTHMHLSKHPNLQNKRDNNYNHRIDVFLDDFSQHSLSNDFEESSENHYFEWDRIRPHL